ncbi:MAG: MFS transporter [Janthinobacterium lividum]
MIGDRPHDGGVLDATALEDSAYKKICLRIIPILFVCYLIAYLDRINISFAKLEMLADTGLGNTAYAVGASLFFWSYMVLEVPSNIILKKVGARVWIARIMVTWGIVSILTMFVNPLAQFFHVSTTTVFYTLRVLLGACEAGFLPGVFFYLSNWCPASKQSRVFAAFLMSLPISLVLGGPLSGWILQHSEGLGLYRGWQWLFFFEGAPSVIVGLVVWFLLPNNIETAKWLTAGEKQALSHALASESSSKTGSVLAAIKDFRVWMLILIIVALNIGFYGLSFWLPSIIHQAGITNTFTIGLLSAIPWLFSVPCMLINAAHSNRTGERRWHAAGPALLSGVAFILSAMVSHNFPLALGLLSVAVGAMLAAFPVYWTFPNQLLTGAAAAAGLALINSIGALAGVAGAMTSMVAEKVTGDMNNGTYVFGICLLIGGLLILAIPRAMSAREKPSAGTKAAAFEHRSFD